MHKIKADLLEKLSKLEKEKDGFFNTVKGCLAAKKASGITKPEQGSFFGVMRQCGLMQSSIEEIKKEIANM